VLAPIRFRTLRRSEVTVEMEGCAVANEKPVSHGLGVGSGSIIEHSNGVVEYRQTGKLLPAFRVNIADVTGFATRKATKQDKKNGAGAFTVMIVLYGGGTELGAAAVNYGTPEKIEAWFRAHPLFSRQRSATAAAGRAAAVIS
jgi:hypothetical protein